MKGFRLHALSALTCSSVAMYAMLCIWLWMEAEQSNGALSVAALRKAMGQSLVAGILFFLILLIALPLMSPKEKANGSEKGEASQTETPSSDE